ncbi:MAG: CHAD domain-containing protein [Terracidiphilus sp.]|jgi:CHAD domain-containing protein
MADEQERARKAMRELSKTLKSLLGDPAPKEVHKLRTAARRVEAIAAVLARNDEKKSRRLLKSIEPVRKAAGGVRNMDVLTANARRLARRSAGDSLTRLLDHLQIARQQNAEKLRRVLARRRDAAREDLKQYARMVRSALAPAKGAEPAGGQAGQRNEGVHTAAMDAVRELGSWPPLNADNIHAFRLKVKELRYVLQLSADADSGMMAALSDVQRRVGDWHDWQQLDEIARAVLTREEDIALLTRIDQTVRRKLDRALAAANSLRGKYLAMPLADGI